MHLPHDYADYHACFEVWVEYKHIIDMSFWKKLIELHLRLLKIAITAPIIIWLSLVWFLLDLRADPNNKNRTGAFLFNSANKAFQENLEKELIGRRNIELTFAEHNVVSSSCIIRPIFLMISSDKSVFLKQLFMTALLLPWNKDLAIYFLLGVNPRHLLT